MRCNGRIVFCIIKLYMRRRRRGHLCDEPLETNPRHWRGHDSILDCVGLHIPHCLDGRVLKRDGVVRRSRRHRHRRRPQNPTATVLEKSDRTRKSREWSHRRDPLPTNRLQTRAESWSRSRTPGAAESLASLPVRASVAVPAHANLMAGAQD